MIQTEADFEVARAQEALEGWLSFFGDDAGDFPASPNADCGLLHF